MKNTILHTNNIPMKQLNLLIFLFVFFLFYTADSRAQTPPDLFFSEYVEGSSNNKAIELYNGTGNTVDLASGNYTIQMYFNGSTTAGTTISLTGTIAPGGVFVLANASASFASDSYVNQTSSASWYNGDDAVVLKKGGAAGTVIDAIGQVGFDPGTEWGSGLVSTADNTIRRKSSVCNGDTDPVNVFNPLTEWDGFAADDFTGLGLHTSNCALAGPSIQLSPASLDFVTDINTTSQPLSYLLQGFSLTDDVTVTAPPYFAIADSVNGSYGTIIIVTADSANKGKTIYVVYQPTASGTQTGNITHTSGSVVSGLTVQGTAITDSITHIYSIQGSGAASPLKGNIVTTEGIVTGDYQSVGQLGGFYMQDFDGDGDTTTSDGVFVFDTTFQVNVGDKVRLTADVDEFFNLTELKNLRSASVISSGNLLVPPVTIQLPVTATADLEKYEGMLVSFPQTLTVTETFNLGRFGELLLSSDGRLFNPTNFIDPNDNPPSGTNSEGNSNVAAVTAQQDLNNRRTILLDDGSNIQNPAVVPYLNPADTTIRCGSTVQNITGVLTYAFSQYVVEPTESPDFNYALRPAVPSVGNENIKVASFNVLNYFNGNGMGGGFPTERGANTLAEFNRQRTKIIAAIKDLDADVVGLTEIENDGDGANSAIADLVSGLNASLSDSIYTYIPDPVGTDGNTGTDAIKVALIYKYLQVTPVGVAIADTSVINNRPPLAQTFMLNSNGEKLTVIINHLKSKSCSGASGLDADSGYGQGCYNQTRKIQADTLLSFIKRTQAISGDSDVIAVGDFNAYDEEDPLDVLKAGGLTDILPGTYSYVFGGQSGSLDHGYVTPSLVSHVTGAAKWHINADEPTIKDYNQEFNPAYVYNADPYRSSDHDPVLAGLNLQQVNTSPVVSITNPQNGASFEAGSTISITADASDADGSIAKVEFYNGSIKIEEDNTAPYQYDWNVGESGTDTLTAKAYDNKGLVTVSGPVIITVTACTGTGWISADYYPNIKGSSVADLTNNPRYPDRPSIRATIKKFETPSNIADRYGIRVYGYVCAPQTGTYVFTIASDESSELWLSTDSDTAHKMKIAYLNSAVPKRAWNYTASQKSDPIRLIKGKRYYIEALLKENTGKDHLAVAWTLPDGTFEGPIPGNRLSPWELITTDQLISHVEKSNYLKPVITNDLSISVSPNPSASYFTLMINKPGNEKAILKVTDMAGKVMEIKTIKSEHSTLSIGQNLKPGVYFVQLIGDKFYKTLKLIKQ